LKATAKKGKKDKKKAKSTAVEDEEHEIPEGSPGPDKGPVQMTAEELADEEWGPVKDKKKKGKKGKKKGKDDSEDEAEAPQGSFHSIPWAFHAH